MKRLLLLLVLLGCGEATRLDYQPYVLTEFEYVATGCLENPSYELVSMGSDAFSELELHPGNTFVMRYELFLEFSDGDVMPIHAEVFGAYYKDGDYLRFLPSSWTGNNYFLSSLAYLPVGTEFLVAENLGGVCEGGRQYTYAWRVTWERL